MELIFLPPCSTTLNRQPLVAAPLASTSLHFVARSVLAGGRVGGALLEEDTVAWPVVQEGEEYEPFAVGVGGALRLALKL